MDDARLQERCQDIQLLMLDVDGVLTDGGIVYAEQGAEIKAFHVRDGLGVKLWQKAGRRVAILSGRTSSIVERRAQELGFDLVLQGIDDKRAAFESLLEEIAL